MMRKKNSVPYWEKYSENLVFFVTYFLLLAIVSFSIMKQVGVSSFFVTLLVLAELVIHSAFP